MPHRSGNPTWQDYPSTATIITASALNALEGAVDASGVSTVTTVAAAGAAQALTIPAHGSAAYDLTGSAASCALSFSGGTAGEECWLTLYLHQDGTGGRSWTFPGGVRWPNGNITPAFSTNPGQYDVVSLVTVDGGATFTGFVSGIGWQAPAVPSATTLSGTAGNTQNVLNWTAAAGNGATVTGYKVYRGLSSGTETLVTTVGAVLTYTDTGRTNGTAYYYKVSAVNSVGEGPLSNEVSLTPAVGGGVSIATDTFTGADSATTISSGRTTETGSKTWTSYASTNWGILSNQAYQSLGSSPAIAVINAGVNDYTVQADVVFSGAPDDSGIVFRATDSSNWLNFMVDPGGYYIQRNVAGSQSNATNVASTNAAGTYTLKVVVSGSTATCYVNGVSKITYTITDSALLTGANCGLTSQGGANPKFDNFSVTT